MGWTAPSPPRLGGRGAAGTLLWAEGTYPAARSPASLELLLSLPAASGSRDQSPAVVVTVVTISAILVLGSVMSVLAIWRR